MIRNLPQRHACVRRSSQDAAGKVPPGPGQATGTGHRGVSRNPGESEAHNGDRTRNHLSARVEPESNELFTGTTVKDLTRLVLSDEAVSRRKSSGETDGDARFFMRP